MIAETWTDSLAYSDYIGWVVYDQAGAPIFEYVPWGSDHGVVGTTRADNGRGYAQPIPDAMVLPFRARGRNCLDWKDLPHGKLQRVEIYFGREHIPPSGQPAVSLDARPGSDVRFFQRKQQAILVHAAGHIVEKSGQHRTGIIFYRVGFFNVTKGVGQMFEVHTQPFEIQGELRAVFQYPAVRNPTWPHPGKEAFNVQKHGYGIQPDTIRPALPLEHLHGPPIEEAADAGSGLVQP